MALKKKYRVRFGSLKVGECFGLVGTAVKASLYAFTFKKASATAAVRHVAGGTEKRAMKRTEWVGRRSCRTGQPLASASTSRRRRTRR